MLDKTSSIICAFGLASAAPRSPYRHLELCGIALGVESAAYAANFEKGERLNIQNCARQRTPITLNFQLLPPNSNYRFLTAAITRSQSCSVRLVEQGRLTMYLR
ncbi:MAG: hypothetical protein PUD46_08355 [Subdoligranulum sp.]|nr:hypothetical protein [Subdoligranulum sp.]